VKLVSYTHYPQVSSSMVEVVARGVSQFNNSSAVAHSLPKRMLKRVYYQVLIAVYKVLGRGPAVLFANSSWTKDHLVQLWGGDVKVLYPPCDIEEFRQARNVRGEGNRNAQNIVVSFAQFRPEK